MRRGKNQLMGWVEKPGDVRVPPPTSDEKSGPQVRAQEYEHAPQLSLKSRAPKEEESSAEPWPEGSNSSGLLRLQ